MTSAYWLKIHKQKTIPATLYWQISSHRKKSTFRWKFLKFGNQPFCYLIFIYYDFKCHPFITTLFTWNLRRSTSWIEQRTFQVEVRWQLLRSTTNKLKIRSTDQPKLFTTFRTTFWASTTCSMWRNNHNFLKISNNMVKISKKKNEATSSYPLPRNVNHCHQQSGRLLRPSENRKTIIGPLFGRGFRKPSTQQTTKLLIKEFWLCFQGWFLDGCDYPQLAS